MEKKQPHAVVCAISSDFPRAGRVKACVLRIFYPRTKYFFSINKDFKKDLE
jgi:hypothetical protein